VGEADHFDFFTLPARGTSSASTGPSHTAAPPLRLSMTARVAIRTLRSEKIPLTARGLIALIPAVSTAAQYRPIRKPKADRYAVFPSWGEKSGASRLCVSSYTLEPRVPIPPAAWPHCAIERAGSMEDGPGVSINRTGGSEFANVLRHDVLPLLILALITPIGNLKRPRCALGAFLLRGNSIF